MNFIDIIILIPLAIGALGGFRKGFILEIVSLLALILAVIGGFQFLHWGISVLTENFQLSGKFRSSYLRAPTKGEGLEDKMIYNGIDKKLLTGLPAVAGTL